MKKSWCLFILVLIVACNNKPKRAIDTPNQHAGKIKLLKFDPYKLNIDFSVTDTGSYINEGPMSGGTYGIVKNNELTDTIDMQYGIKSLGGRVYLFHKLKHETDPVEKETKGLLCLEEDKYIIAMNKMKYPLDSLARSFDDYYSSPEVIKGKIYFWQLEKIDSAGKIRVSAAEFNPIAKTTATYYLFNDYLETDDSGYFPLPYLKNDTVYFDGGKNKLNKFSKDFKRYN